MFPATGMTMRELERRLRLLEAWTNPGGCLECECERLNRAAAKAPATEQACTHQGRLTLLDALTGLHAMESHYAEP